MLTTEEVRTMPLDVLKSRIELEESKLDILKKIYELRVKIETNEVR